MNTRALALLIAAALVGAGGCADNMTSIEIREICFPPEDAAACTFQSTCERQLMGNAAVDVGVTNALLLPIQVNNQTTNNADPGTNRANSRDAYIEEINVEFEAPFLVPSTRERVGPFFVPAGGSNVIAVTAVSPVASAAIEAGFISSTAVVGIVAKTKLKGHYQDQSPFETAAYEIAVDACDGCGQFDPTPCTTGFPVALCPDNPGQQPLTVKCQ